MGPNGKVNGGDKLSNIYRYAQPRERYEI